MAVIQKKRLYPVRLNRRTVGCGIQGSQCMAMDVSGRAGAWRVKWALLGDLPNDEDPGDASFVALLPKKVRRRSLWASLRGDDAIHQTATCGIYLGAEDEAKMLSSADRKQMMETQVRDHFAPMPDGVSEISCGLVLRGHHDRHMVGAAAWKHVIDDEFRFWRRRMRISNPHIGSIAAAIANLYLALYPEDRRKDLPCRMLVLVIGRYAHTVLMDDWRLIDSLQHLILNQQLNDELLGQWQMEFDHRRTYVTPPPPPPDSPMSPLVIAGVPALGEEESFEVWHPFADGHNSDGSATQGAATGRQDMKIKTDAMALIDDQPQLAALAFGMALQGA